MNWAEAWDWIAHKAGYVFLLAVASFTVWWPILKTVVGKWLDRRFEQKMKMIDQEFADKIKRVEQQHDVMVRHLQSSIDREFDRATRLQTKEFDALSKGWSLLHEAYWRVRQATARGHRVHDFTVMEPGQAEPFIRHHDELADWQKDALLQLERPQDRNSRYHEWWWWIQHRNCERARMKLVMFIDRSAIFMQPEIRQEFDKLQKLISDALIELEMRIQGARGENTFDKSAALIAAEEPVYKSLEAMIHKRLWSSTIAVQPKDITKGA